MRLTLILIILQIFQVLEYLIMGRVFLSWVFQPTHPIMAILRQITDPLVLPFTKLSASIFKTGMFDFGPLLAMFFLYFARIILIKSI